MTTTPSPSPDFFAGFDAGLQSAKQLQPDLSVLALADALDRLALHAGAMGDDDPHASCLYCTTNILLARVVSFGDQLREDEKRARRS